MSSNQSPLITWGKRAGALTAIILFFGVAAKAVQKAETYISLPQKLEAFQKNQDDFKVNQDDFKVNQEGMKKDIKEILRKMDE